MKKHLNFFGFYFSCQELLNSELTKAFFFFAFFFYYLKINEKKFSFHKITAIIIFISEILFSTHTHIPPKNVYQIHLVL